MRTDLEREILDDERSLFSEVMSVHGLTSKTPMKDPPTEEKQVLSQVL